MEGFNNTIPVSTFRRFPMYRSYLKHGERQGIKFVSCSVIGRDLGFDSTQVCKDIQLTGIVGEPEVSRPVSALIRAIDSLMGWDNVTDAFLAGAGSLGMALLGYKCFSQLGFNIVAAFDVDHEKIGRECRGKEILSLERLPGLARRMGIHIGIITVPAKAAQNVADLMIEGGIRAIWNFAPIALKLPEEIIVQNEDLYKSLAVLSCKLASKMHVDHRQIAEAASVALPWPGDAGRGQVMA